MRQQISDRNRLTSGTLRTSHLAPRTSNRGVALIVTLIMLAVITFMATTFLVLSRRERNSVSTNTDQTTARFTADTALERAKAQLLAGILATTNDQNFDLMVPTNFFNPYGFDPAAVDYRTNVNYGYTAAPGNPPLTALQQQQNIANLLYDPRPPVYITNTKVTNDFRYYLDLNRNGLFDDSGSISNLVNVNGTLVMTNNIDVVGDPQWIGVLRFPERPHSADNPFESRWTYIVVPAGKTLDVNYLHNRAKQISLAGEGFLRNQGVGTWEINLAAFLADLNTNQWWSGNNYNYDLTGPPFGTSSSGFAFNDANSLLNYRYNGSYLNISNASSIFFGGATAFQNDGIDENSDGPLMNTTAGINESIAGNQDILTKNWSGADNPNHFFTTQDFFDAGKTSVGFVNRLSVSGFFPDTYNRYTFYRMLEQLGTDSSPPVEDKININYRNVTNGVVVSGMETNLYAWSPLEFFTNSAAKLFEKLNLRDNFGNLITVTNIPLWGQTVNFSNINNNFYTPAVHRVLQLAANIYDAQTNGIYPSIYRPFFSYATRGGTNQIYISGYELVNAPNDTTTPSQFLGYAGDLSDSVTRSTITTDTKTNIYGAPWVIAAKKGFPNLNQVAFESVSQMTRKLLIYRPLVRNDWIDYRGKQMFILGISNSMAVEIWNSYNTVYPRPLYIKADWKMTVELTNDVGFKPAPFTYYLGGYIPGGVLGVTNVLASTLRNTGLNPGPNPPPANTQASQQASSRSFVLPFQTNVVVLPDSVQIGNQMYVADSTSAAQWNNIPWDNLSDPHWGMNITNSVRCFVMDGGSSGRVVDYVQMKGLDSMRILTQETTNSGTANKLDVWTQKANSSTYWATAGNPMSQGVFQQIQISMGAVTTSATDWSDNNLAAGTKNTSIAYFNNFMTANNVASNTIQAPFSPTAKFYQLAVLEANDPLVHYLPEDLGVSNLPPTYTKPPNNDPTFKKATYFVNRLNERYSPWGGYGPRTTTDPHAFDTAMKDSLVMASDNWNFPTNKFPSVGWLGRVHRGTPWQTVYMKANDILGTDPTAWQKWSGSANLFLATNIAPFQDRQLFEIFTTAISDNATRGQLSINQTNLAAWSAVLSGVIVLTNDPTSATYNSTIINPAGVYSPGILPLPPIVQIVQGINSTRTNFASQTFTNLGDFLATPELTDMSPYLITNNLQQLDAGGISDEVLERIPQQIMSLVTISHSPRFVVYSYGQTLHPANNSVITASGQFNGLCTNYQVTAETATRAVIRIEGAPKKPHIIIEQYNVLPPD